MKRQDEALHFEYNVIFMSTLQIFGNEHVKVLFLVQFKDRHLSRGQFVSFSFHLINTEGEAIILQQHLVVVGKSFFLNG